MENNSMNRPSIKMSFSGSRTRYFFYLIVCLLFFSVPVGAQGKSTYSLKVIDKDLELPLEGVRVLDPSTGGVFLTDPEGIVKLPSLPALLVLSLPGYEEKRVRSKEWGDQNFLLVNLRLAGILEAEELVVETQAAGRSDAQPGVSVTAERELIKITGLSGVVEDAMNTVRILPGVIYAGRFNPFLSVRGGDPGGLAYHLDGALMKNPFHWGGTVSYFNPRLVESLKLSAGIFSVRNGQATSGLLEINTVIPDEGLKWEVGTSISTLDGYVQVPLDPENRSGLLAGARITNYDIVFALTGNFLEEGQGITFSRVPYIYNFYLKWFSRPDNRFQYHLNIFAGQDGIGLRTLDPDVDITIAIQNTFDFTWTNRDLFLSGGSRWLPGDRLSIHTTLGYEYWDTSADGGFTEKGTRTYSTEFVNAYGGLYGIQADDSFSLDLQSSFRDTTALHQFQARVDNFYTLTNQLTLEAGGGGYLSLYRFHPSGSIWNISYLPDNTPVYRKEAYTSGAENNNILVSFAYIGSTYDWVPDRFRLEGGLRVDHGYFWGKGDFNLNTLPVLGPRVIFQYTPLDGKPAPLTFSLGTGIFSKIPFDVLSITRDMGLKDYDIKTPKSYTTVAGVETYFGDGFRFKLEGYYKYLFDRFYSNFIPENETLTSRDLMLRFHNDGIGHSAGFDVLLDRRTSRYFDGMLSYSFNVARYKNPQTDGLDSASTGFGGPNDPRGRWYYPSFHRFHSLNLLTNYKPTTWLTLSTRLSFATGTPEPRYGEKEMFAAQVINQDNSTTIAEMYTRKSFYSDSLRGGWALPLDVKFSFHFYRKGSKVYHEFYLGAEDILSVWYTSLPGNGGPVTTDRYTGEDTLAPSAGFNFPVITFGFRASY